MEEIKQRNLDLVMWTLNSGRTLETSLRSINRVIPDSRVCHRIMVDGGSSDNTVDLGIQYGWEVFSSQTGIWRQANFALSRVDTETYASFEHDIVLAENWLTKVEAAIARPRVAVAQGIRLFLGSGAVAAMDRWNYEHHTISAPYVSLDNDLCKTALIREIGGYAAARGADGTDSRLLAAVSNRGYEWVIDQSCVSGHLRPSFSAYSRHFLRHYHQTLVATKGERGPRPVARLLFSPLRGAQMAARYHAFPAFPGYPVYRFLTLVAARAANPKDHEARIIPA